MYNMSDIATNVPGMTEEMRVFCSSLKTCLREYILKYLGSCCAVNDPHSCCSNCSSGCTCQSCKNIAMQNLQFSTVPQTDSQTARVREVPDAKKKIISHLMKQYRLEIGANQCRFGSIDQTTGFTLHLTESLVARCDYIRSADDMYSTFPIWDKDHAVKCMQIIEEVCGE